VGLLLAVVVAVAVGGVAVVWRATRDHPCPTCGAAQTFIQPFADGAIIRECDRCGATWELRGKR